MKKNILLLFLFKFVFLYSQSFTGVLTYNYITDDYKQMEMLSQFGIDGKYELNNLTEKIYINKDTLKSEKYAKDGLPLFSGMEQHGDSAYIYNDINEVYFNIDKIQPKRIKYRLIKKTKVKKIILQQECTKYIYEMINPNIAYSKTTILAWIPEGFKYPDTLKYGKFFKLFFFEGGLAFEKELLYNGTKRIWTLTDIKSIN